MKKIYYSVLFALLGVFASCSNDELQLSSVDESQYQVSENIQKGYITDEVGKREFTVTEFRTDGITKLFLKATSKSEGVSVVSVTYDTSVLDSYNASTENEYKAFPMENVTIANEGNLTLDAGSIKSSALEIKYKSDGSLSADESYVIPLRINVKEGNMKINEEDSSFLLFVKDVTGKPDCNKSNGFKMFSCVEVNSVNPLNNMCFTLSESGKYLFDCVIIFAANINYNEEEGKVYIHKNPNVQHLLDNRDKYIQPLQDCGMKVLLAILGNHDHSGVANLAPETALAYAREIKATCDAYNLDGIFFNDEWSQYPNTPLPGFVDPSEQAAARLFYEVKKLQPERWNVCYDVGLTANFTTEKGCIFDGKNAGYYLDYTFTNYKQGYRWKTYEGHDIRKYGIYSVSYSDDTTFFTASESNLKDAKTEADVHLVYNLSPFQNGGKADFNSAQIPSLQRIANVFYGEELVYDEKPFAKDY